MLGPLIVLLSGVALTSVVALQIVGHLQWHFVQPSFTEGAIEVAVLAILIAAGLARACTIGATALTVAVGAAAYY